MKPTSAAVAVLVQLAVESGDYADVALADELDRARLEPGATHRATALAFGAIRLRRRCDFVLRPHLSRPLPQLDPVLRAVLRVGAYEILWAGRVNAPAAVHNLVGIAGELGHKGLMQFANGVLRRLVEAAASDRETPAALLEPDQLEERLVQWESHPRWLVRRWLERYGPSEALRLCLADNQEPQVHLRVNPLRCDRDSLLATLRGAGLEATPGSLSEHCVRVAAAGSPAALPGYARGWFTVQDEGAMLLAPVCGAQPGQRVIDLCAAPGGKTTHLGELMAGAGEILACDRNAERLHRVEQSAARLGLRLIRCRPGDVRETLAAEPPADVVLLDAPCTGTGTLARRPDLRWHVRAERLSELVALQRDLLRLAARLTRPGGLLVYATCSLEPEENEAQMDWFDREVPGFEPAAGGPPPPAWDAARGQAAILPRDGHDGFFVAGRRRTG